MPEQITFNLRANRTRDQVFCDAALSNGWTEKVKQIGELQHVVNYDVYVQHGSVQKVLEAASIEYDAIKSGENRPDGKTVITYTTATLVDNPVTMIEFGKRIVAQVFDRYDADSAAKAAKVRETIIADSAEATQIA